ncbi:UNVERIFIED_CONTAM: hypothetical protein FKN15_047817 [Acipenser sinensis]
MAQSTPILIEEAGSQRGAEAGGEDEVRKGSFPGQAGRMDERGERGTTADRLARSMDNGTEQDQFPHQDEAVSTDKQYKQELAQVTFPVSAVSTAQEVLYINGNGTYSCHSYSGLGGGLLNLTEASSSGEFDFSIMQNLRASLELYMLQFEGFGNLKPEKTDQ